MVSIKTYICACALTLCVVTSLPVYPEGPLHHFTPTDICLFLCNVCFDDMGPEMMDCANKVCLAKDKYDMNLGFLKLGRTCTNSNKLDDFIFGNETD